VSAEREICVGSPATYVVLVGLLASGALHHRHARPTMQANRHTDLLTLTERWGQSFYLPVRASVNFSPLPRNVRVEPVDDVEKSDDQ
jgi:hypothetical protein